MYVDIIARLAPNQCGRILILVGRATENIYKHPPLFAANIPSSQQNRRTRSTPDPETISTRRRESQPSIKRHGGLIVLHDLQADGMRPQRRSPCHESAHRLVRAAPAARVGSRG